MSHKDVIVKALMSLSLISTAIFTHPVKAGTMGNTTIYHPWRFVIEAGIVPTIYNKAEDNYGFFPNSTSPQLDSKEFNDQSHTPWAAGGEIAYAWNPDNEAFAEFNYARGASKVFSTTYSNTMVVGRNFSAYSQFAGFLGVRHFFQVNMPRAHPYLGVKLGAIRREKTTAIESYAGSTPNATPLPIGREVTYYNADTSFAGGVQVGVDYRSTENWGTGIKAEIVASGKRDSAVIPYNAPLNNLTVGNTGMVLQFPFMIYFKYWI